MKTKAEAPQAMANLLDKELSPFGRQCNRLHGDRAGEFMGEAFTQMCNERRIKATYAATATPQHNGLAEVIHYHSGVLVSSMLADAGLSEAYWPEALEHATYLHNVMPTAGLPGGISPFEAWTGEKPNLENLRPFGCRLYYSIDGGALGRRLWKVYTWVRF